MKELSIEEKAKRYDEALEKSKILYEQGTITESLCYVFPELKESEDDKVRKKLIHLVKKSHEQGGYALHKWESDEMLAWLEKQGEHKRFRDFIQIGDKVTRNESGELVNLSQLERVAKPRRAKSADKVEPKFHEGEWITNGDYTWKIVEVKPLDYILKSQDGNIVDDTISHVDEQFHSFTIQDAKDGDVLAVEAIEENYPYPFVAIYKERGLNFFNSYCFIGFDGKFYEAAEGHSIEKIHPATKEQRDLLFQKMKEAGYEWDANKKKLKKIVTPIFHIGDTIAKKHNSDIHDFGSFTITDITGSKYWYNDRIICDISEQDEWEIYESIRPQNRWKPSDEQMYNLSEAAHYNCAFFDMEILKELYDDLKKLREE